MKAGEICCSFHCMLREQMSCQIKELANERSDLTDYIEVPMTVVVVVVAAAVTLTLLVVPLFLILETN